MKVIKPQRIEYTVQADYQNYRLDKIMRKLQPHWSKVYVQKLIRNKDIKVNQKKTSSSYHLQVNDVIEYYGINDLTKVELHEFNLQQLQKLPKLEVIYEDEAIIIVNKPHKVAVQSHNSRNYDNMNNRLIKHLNFDSPTKFKPVFVHRLDTNTTGLLIGAKTYQAYQQLFLAFKNKWIQKTYYALVWNPFEHEHLVIKNHLLKNEQLNKSFQVHSNTPHAKIAWTEVFLCKNYKNQALLKLHLKTGRSHQLRVHLASINHSICGDKKYGINPDNNLFEFQALIAAELQFSDQICHGALANLKNQAFKIEKFWFLDHQYLTN